MKWRNKKHRALILLLGTYGLTMLMIKFALAQDSSPAPVASYSFKNPFASLLPEKKPEEAPSKEAASKPIIEQPKVVVVTPPNLSVTGIVWNSNRPQAIINNQVVGVGDTIAEVTIVNITRNGVGFEYNGKRFIINPDKGIAEPVEQFN